MDDCIHGLMVGTCVLCKPRPVAVAPAGPRFRRGHRGVGTMVAEYDSVCARCGDWINAGYDTIERDEHDDWVHTHCFPSSLMGEENH